MLDIKWIRENKSALDNALAKRGIEPASETLLRLDEESRELKTLIQQFRQAKNKKTKILSTLGHSSKEFHDTKRDIIHINDKLEELEKKTTSEDPLQNLLDNLPNRPADEVPIGADETMNKFVRSWGDELKKTLEKQHFDIGTDFGLMDFKSSAEISGSRFVVLKGDLARLERALVSFMLDVHTSEFDFLEISPPYLVRRESMYRGGLLPKFSEESFETTDGYRLIPTGEIPLINLVADKILPRESLPLRFASYTPCFRREAGSAGRDTRGMVRLHQFGKVELVSVTSEEESTDEHEYITNAAEEILKRLGLPYRIMLLCSGDLGFQAAKTYDIEVWLPGQNTYREISSCSNCTDFQARRMKARYRELGESENRLVHTLNGSGLPIGRTMVAIIENYYDPSSKKIKVPEVLVPYMGGRTEIGHLEG